MARTLPSERHWFPSHQPQTLQFAAALLYWNAVWSLIFGILLGGGIGHVYLLFCVAEVAGAYGIANERRWGYVVAIGAAVVPLIFLVAVAGFFGAGLLNLLFQIALIALLLHPQSRSYTRLWYR